MTKAIPATTLKDMGPTSSTFDVSDQPSMGDLEFVEERVRAMVKEAHDAMHDGKPDDGGQIAAIVERWVKEFTPANKAYTQTLSVGAQAAFLRKLGLGTNDTDPDGPLRALIAETLIRYVDAAVALREDQIDEDNWQFQIDAAIEDCTHFLVGLDNPAD
jgi:hypothetical protein